MVADDPSVVLSIVCIDAKDAIIEILHQGNFIVFNPRNVLSRRQFVRTVYFHMDLDTFARQTECSLFRPPTS